MKKFYTASRVFFDGEFKENVYLGVENDRISSIKLSPPKENNCEIIDFGSFVIFPATVNTHNHSFQSFLRGRVDDKGLEDWLQVVYKISSNFDSDACKLAGMLNFAEMLKNGTTTVADFFYLNGKGNDNIQATIDAATNLGIRIDMGRAFIDAEWGGKSTIEDVDIAEKRYRELVVQNKNSELVHIHPCPHSLYGASRSLIELAAGLSEEYDVKWHMHLADSYYSSEKIHAEFGSRSVELLDEWNILSSRFVGIHGMWLSENEIRLLSNNKCCISHNPASNLFLGERILDISSLMDNNICVAIGTDGSASNNSQNIFSDIRLVSLTQRLLHRNPKAIPIKTLINIITKNGGALLDLPVGSLDKGQKADFIVINPKVFSLLPNSSLESNFIHSFSERSIEHVFCNGKQVVSNGKLLLIDEDELIDEIDCFMKKIE